MSNLEAIKRLREATGAGMMDAKAALEEAGGDNDKAVAILRQKGQAKAAGRSTRETKAGLVDAYVHMGRVAALVEVQCETDFVARTDEFKQFVHQLAMHVAAANPQYLAPENVPGDVLAREQAIYKEQLGDKADKAMDGKVAKFYSEVCLLKQPSVQDPDHSIEQLLTQLAAKLGENILVARFARFELGG